METNQDTGIWGGTSEEERRQMRREAAARARAARISTNNSGPGDVVAASPLPAEELADQ
jgi:hypothetical protein